jgi:peptidoglycan LD-endopeptidase CwlK
MFKLGPRSKMRLEGVHPDLVRVVDRAIEISTVDFTVLEGLRTPERQKTLLESGASQTMNSRHITGHAVDLGAWVDSQVDWSWPLYHKIAAAMKTAAKELGVSIVWGGDWRNFKDGPHFELDRKVYPSWTR